MLDPWYKPVNFRVRACLKGWWRGRGGTSGLRATLPTCRDTPCAGCCRTCSGSIKIATHLDHSSHCKT